MDEDWPHPELDAAEVLRTLGRHEVDYVLIGGLALTLYGSNQLTFDIDLVPVAEHANLDRLASAMRELRRSVEVRLHGLVIHLAGLDDIATSKERQVARRIFRPLTRLNDSGVNHIDRD